MDLKKYFNSGSKKRDLSSETSTSGDDPKKTILMMFLLKGYLPLIVSRFYVTVLRMLRINTWRSY